MEIVLVQPKQMKLEKEIVKKRKIRWSMLISHHPPQQYCRTYKFLGIRICARCLGIPIGIIFMLFVNTEIPFWGLFILPLPTFLNFLLQELKIIPSINWLKTILTVLLGISFVEFLRIIKNENYLVGTVLFLYLFVIELIIAGILNKQNRLEPLIELYEKNIYKE